MAASLLQRVEFFQRLLRESDYKSGTIRVAVALLFSFYNGKTGRCDPGQAAIALAAGVSARHVKFAVDQLKADAWFDVSGGEGTVTRYGRTTAYRPRIAADEGRGAEPADENGDLKLPQMANQGVPALAPVKPSQGVPALSGVPALTGVSARHQGVPALAPRTLERTKERISQPIGDPDGAARATALTGISAKLAEQFETFWRAYPSRAPHSNPKKPARAKFAAAVKRGVDPAAIIRGAGRYAAYVERDGTDSRFVAQASTWLNRDGWTDAHEPQEDRPRAGMI